MARLLLTGMSGAGKSTLLQALSRRGYVTVDTDHDGWELGDGTWDAPRMDALLEQHPTLAVSGTVPNQGRFYDRFEVVALLTAPLEVLLDRVAARTNNPYGRTPEDRVEIARNLLEVEPLLHSGATHVLDGREPVERLADTLAPLLGPPSSGPS